MKTFGIVILTIATGGIYGIVYAICRKSRQRKANELERATIEYAYAYKEYDESLSEEDKKIVTKLNVTMNKFRDAEKSILGD